MYTKSITNKSYYPWLAWSCAGLFFCFQFIIRVSPGVFSKNIMADLDLDACSFGTLSSYYYIGYTSMQIVVGLMLDRVGVRKPLAIAILMCAIGALISGMASTYYPLAFGRLLMGIGSAFGFLSCVKIGTSWFAPEKLGQIIGISMLLGPLGAVVGGAPLAFLQEHIGWQDSMLLLGFMGITLALCSYLIVREKAVELTAEPQDEMSIMESITLILKKPQTYVLGLFGSLMYVGASAFADLWGASFIEKAYGFSTASAAGVVSFFYIGFSFGGPLMATVVDKMQSYKKPMVIGGIIYVIALMLIVYLPIFSITTLYVLFAVAGMVFGTNIFAFACVCELNPKSLSGTASGIHNMMCMLSGVIFQPLLGKIMDLTHASSGSTEVGHSVLDYQYALSVVPICILLALIVTFKMKEYYPKKVVVKA